MEKINNTELKTIQLAELAEEVNGNLTLSIGNASLDLTLDKLRRYRDMGYPTDFHTMFTVGLRSGGYNENQCVEFFQKMEEEGYGFRLSFNQIDEDTPLNIIENEDAPLSETFTNLAGAVSSFQTAKGREYCFG